MFSRSYDLEDFLLSPRRFGLLLKNAPSSFQSASTQEDRRSSDSTPGGSSFVVDFVGLVTQGVSFEASNENNIGIVLNCGFCPPKRLPRLLTSVCLRRRGEVDRRCLSEDLPPPRGEITAIASFPYWRLLPDEPKRFSWPGTPTAATRLLLLFGELCCCCSIRSMFIFPDRMECQQTNTTSVVDVDGQNNGFH